MSLSPSPRIIVVAGVPRSGSTWLYNAARLILLPRYPDLTAAWIEDYDPGATGEVHLIKVHTPEQLTFSAHIILTTWRPIEASLASLIRMGWRKNTPEDIVKGYIRQVNLYRHWRGLSDLEIDYDEITQAPEDAVTRVMHLLTGAADIGPSRKIARQLAKAKPPKNGTYDKTTLLHPGHRSGPDTQAPIPVEEVGRILDSILRV